MAIFEGIWLVGKGEMSDSFLSRCFSTPFKTETSTNTTVLVGFLRLLHEITGQTVQTIALTDTSLHIRSLGPFLVILSCKNTTNIQVDQFVYSLGSSLSTAGLLNSENLLNPEKDTEIFRIDRLFEEALEQAITNTNFEIPNMIQPVFTPKHGSGLLGEVRQKTIGTAIREQLNRSIHLIQSFQNGVLEPSSR